MFNIAHCGNSTKIIRSSFMYATTLFSFTPCFIFNTSRFKEQMGCRPITSDEKNQFRDKDCEHFNMRGNVILLPSSFASQSTVSRTYYVYRTAHTLKLRRTKFGSLSEQDSCTVYMRAGSSWIWNSPTYTATTSTSSRALMRHVIEIEPLSDLRVRIYVERHSRSNDSSPWFVQYTQFVEEYSPDLKKRRSGQVSFVTTPVSWDSIPMGAWSTIKLAYIATCGQDLPNTFRVDPALMREKFLGRTILVEPPGKLYIPGDLAQQAADNTKALDINTPMYLVEFFKLASLARSMLGVLKGNVNAKDLANAYLSVRYGLKLTLKDTQEIADAIRRQAEMLSDLERNFETTRSQTSVPISRVGPLGYKPLEGTRYYKFKLYYRPYDSHLMKEMRKLWVWDFYPSLQNLWDYIPFSFVIDWFVGVEDQLERMDHASYITTLQILSCILSTRDVFTNVEARWLIDQPAGVIVEGDLEVIVYERRVLPRPPQPISRFDVPRSFNSWVDGLALLIQRR